MSESDAILLGWIAQAREGDQEAFAELVYSFTDAVYNLCYRMLGDSAEAEDATQEAFIRVFYNLKSYDPTRSFKTWLLSIASNHAIDRLRKRRVQVHSLDESLEEGASLSLQSDEPLPEEVTLRNEHSAAVQAMLNSLAPEYRIAVVLRYWYDYSYQEIATALNTTESAIKSRLFRARQMLADAYAAQPTRPRLERGRLRES